MNGPTIYKVIDLKPISIPVREAKKLLSVCENSFKQFAGERGLPIYKIGRVPHVRLETLEAVIAQLEQEAKH